VHQRCGSGAMARSGPSARIGGDPSKGDAQKR
jgi:hypothetical protein